MTKGWKEKKLGEITTKIGSGATPLGGENAYKSEGTSLIRSLNVHDGGFKYKDLAFLDDTQADKLSNVIVESGDVLLNITGASIARCCIVPDDILPARVNQHVSIIRLVKDEVLPEFLHYALISNEYKDSLLKTGEKGGSTRQALTKAQIEEFPIKYPPLSEQQRIVSLLDETFAGLAQVHANAERNLVNAREVFGSYLESLFADSRSGWEEKKLGDVCERITDGTHVTPKYVPEGVPFLSVKNLTKGFIDFSDTRFITPEEHAILTKRVRPERDDVLYTKVGTTGIAKVVDIDVEFSIFVSIALLKLKHDMIFNKYLEFFLNSPFARKQAQQRTRGTANKNLVITDIKEIEIHFPKSLEEQRAIVQRLDALAAETSRLEVVYQSKLEAVEELKKSVLGKAFEGEL